jgi:hypothetical protein
MNLIEKRERYKKYEVERQAKWNAFSDGKKVLIEQRVKQERDEWNRHYDLEALSVYKAMRFKYKLRTKYNLRTVRSIINAVESGKIVIEDSDFPYGNYKAFKESVNVIDYDDDNFGQKPNVPWCYMTMKEYLQWIESGHSSYSINFNPQSRGYSSYEAWKAAVLAGDLDN